MHVELDGHRFDESIVDRAALEAKDEVDRAELSQEAELGLARVGKLDRLEQVGVERNERANDDRDEMLVQIRRAQSR